MALNFPASPTNGQSYTNGQNTWVYDSSKNSWKNVKNLSSSARQQFVATANQTTFVISGGYIPGQLDVYYNGVKLSNGVDVDLSSGTNIVLSTGVPENSRIEVIGLSRITGYPPPVQSSRLLYTASNNQTTFTTPTYVPGSSQVRLYINGVRQYNTDYTETSNTSITLGTGCVSGDSVMIEVDGYSDTIQLNIATNIAISSAGSGTYYPTIVSNSAGNLAAQTNNNFNINLSTGTLNVPSVNTGAILSNNTPVVVQAAGGAIIENAYMIYNSYTITSGRNATSYGPITLDKNVCVTIPKGSKWRIF